MELVVYVGGIFDLGGGSLPELVVTLNVLDLFSGIGGFSVGLERAGMRTIAFCEIDPYCRAVLRKHWPEVPCFSDVRDLHALDVGPVDVIAGGFPCQDISLAGKGAGLAGERSGLWSEYRRLIEECRPRYAIIENVSALRSRGLDQVLGELAALGYDAEWHCIPASAVGAPHRRDRIWIVAHTNGERQPEWQEHYCGAVEPRFQAPLRNHLVRLREAMAHAKIDGRDARWPCDAQEEQGRRQSRGGSVEPNRGDWSSEPDVGRVVNGFPSRVDRLKCLGNAVVPQVVQAIGEAILSAEHSANSYARN